MWPPPVYTGSRPFGEPDFYCRSSGYRVNFEAVTREEFDALVKRLQAASEKNPRAYNVRVALLAMLGYGYLIGVLLVSTLLTLGIVAFVIAAPNAGTIKFGLIVGSITGGLAYVLAKALWVRLEPPKGIGLLAADVPELAALLDRLRAKFRGPEFHHVLLDGDYNAGVVQVPLLGVLGWQQNYLCLGLPLMQSLSPGEFEAVLAHEVGHLSGNHGRFGAWIYRVRRSWERAFEEMFKRPQSGGVVLKKFVDWFWPKFNAHAFVLARANEYQADRCSVEFAGAQTAASALMRVSFHGALLDQHFWPGLYKRANSEPEPPQNIYADTAKAFQCSPDPSDSARWLKAAFTLETNNADTHPCLKDRLRALDALPEGVARGEFPSSVPAVTQTAADKFLGQKAPALAEELGQQWRKQVSELWDQRRKHVTELEKEIAAPTESGDVPPGIEQLWTKACAIVDRDGDEAAMPLVEQVLAMDANHVGANFVRGRYLLRKDDAAGVPFVERALAGDETITKPACDLLWGFYSRVGQREKLRELEDRVDKYQERVDADARERNNITAADEFLPPELKPEVLADVNKVLAEERDVFRVFVARKHLTVAPQFPLLVFVVTVKVPWWKPRSSSANQQLLNRLAEKIKPGAQFFVLIPADNWKSVGRKITAVPGAQIYQRAD